MPFKGKTLVKKLVILAIGMIILALGLALSIRAELGISPITTLPYTLSLIVPKISIGLFTIFLHILFFLLTLVLYRKEFKPFLILMLPCSFGFGYVLDFFKGLLEWINVDNYFLRLLILLVSCVIVGFGFSLIRFSGVTLEANTAFLNALVYRSHVKYAILKDISDVTLIIAAFTCSCVFLGKPFASVREGTVIAALLVGPVAGFFEKIYSGKFRLK